MADEESRLTRALNVMKNSRRRFISSVIVLLLACAISLVFADRVIIFLESLAPAGTKFVTYQIAANFEIYTQVALFSGVTLAMPFIIYQIVHSVTPVLPRKQKMYLYTFLPLMLVFFILGLLYATYFHIPLILKFVIGFVSQISSSITPMLDVGKYISFLVKVYFIIGLVFELPVVCYVLAKFGLISHTWLAKKWRWGVLTSAILAALLTPTGDVFRDGLKDLLLVDCGFSVSGPLILLYFFSIFTAWLGRKQPEVIEE